MNASPEPTRVLIVDDEADLRDLLTFTLESAGIAVQAVATAAEGLAAAAATRPTVVILDIMLPDRSGIDVCRQLRGDPATAGLAVLMLTARGNEADRVLGFEVGADDYVVKPFSAREVVMRVHALARRAHETAVAQTAPDQGQRLRWRDLVVDPVRHRVNAHERGFSLRPLEFKLLSLFMEHPGRVFSRGELLEDVWGLSPGTNTRTVDVHIRRLRASLGPYGDAIETVHGVGYRLRDLGI
jgi:two-component system, OmpR family, phosphate regulon response regulator PhoB